MLMIVIEEVFVRLFIARTGLERNLPLIAPHKARLQYLMEVMSRGRLHLETQSYAVFSAVPLMESNPIGALSIRSMVLARSFLHSKCA